CTPRNDLALTSLPCVVPGLPGVQTCPGTAACPPDPAADPAPAAIATTVIARTNSPAVTIRRAPKALMSSPPDLYSGPRPGPSGGTLPGSVARVKRLFRSRATLFWQRETARLRPRRPARNWWPRIRRRRGGAHPERGRLRRAQPADHRPHEPRGLRAGRRGG